MNLTDGFTRDVNLPGWADQSIWGYDDHLTCYWAALWRDDDHNDAPTISFSVYHAIPAVPLLVRLLADALHLPDAKIYRALTT
jgi:hypothetical protein